MRSRTNIRIKILSNNKGMKINLGAGNLIESGYINHDLVKHRKEIELAFNLNDYKWPELYSLEHDQICYLTGKVDEIKAWDVIEHVDSVINFMDNCWDWLKDDGILHLKACGYSNESLYIDITHKRGFHIKSFDYFDPETQIGKEYGYYSSKKWKILEKSYDRKGNVIIKLRKKM